MLGNKIGMLLVITILSFTLISESFAENIFFEFDQSEYNTGEKLTFSGSIPEYSMPIMAISIYDPNGKILSANNLELDGEGNFSKTISLDSPFYDQPGKYKIKINYKKIIQEEFFIITGEVSQSDSILKEKATPEIIFLATEKEEYTDGDTVKITGIVSLKQSTTVLIGIYDPFGTPEGFYFGFIDSNLEFSTNFLVKDGVNFRVDGTYSIKAYYAETEAISFFDYYKISPSIIDDTIQNTIEEKIKENKHVEEKIEESFDEIISESTNISLDKKIITEEKTIEKITNYKIEEAKPIDQKNNSKKIIVKIENKKQTNLTVKDIELGKLLNQINLKCDSSIFTDTISYYDGMGPALYRLCKFDSSLSFFNDSLITNPNDVKILVNKGSTLGKLGYFSEAILYYDQAINIDPNFLPAKNNKANALANLGNTDDAISLYNEILTKNSHYITARKNLEIILSETSQIHNVVDTVDKFEIKNIVNHKPSLSEKTILIDSKKQKPTNFFDEVSLVFSSLGSLFGFLN